MAKEIRWSIRAQQDRIQILDYWIHRNRSNNYARKLNHIFIELSKSISANPDIGIKTDKENVRFRIIGHYLMFYRMMEDYIELIAIWDSRRNPKKINI